MGLLLALLQGHLAVFIGGWIAGSCGFSRIELPVTFLLDEVPLSNPVTQIQLAVSGSSDGLRQALKLRSV